MEPVRVRQIVLLGMLVSVGFRPHDGLWLDHHALTVIKRDAQTFACGRCVGLVKVRTTSQDRTQRAKSSKRPEGSSGLMTNRRNQPDRQEGSPIS